MNAYVTSSAIRRRWERQGLTQAGLAEQHRGFPNRLLWPHPAALGGRGR